MKLIYILTFLLANLIAFSQTNPIDSLNSLIKKENNIEKKVNLYLEIADLKIEKFDISSRADIDSAFKFSKELQNKKLIANCYYKSGKYWKYFDDYEKAINQLLYASNLYNELGDKYYMAEAQRFLGETFRGALNYQFAVSSLDKAYSIFSQIKSGYGLCRTTNRYAAVYFEMMYQDSNSKIFYDSLKKYYHISQKIAIDSNWIDLIVSNLNIFGAAFAHIGKLDSAEKYLYIAKDVAEKNDLKVDIPMILTHLGNIKKQKKEYQKALEYGYEAFYLGRAFNSNQYSQFSAKLLSEVYFLMGNLDSTMKYNQIQFSDYHKIFTSMFDAKRINAEYKIQEAKDIEIKARDEQITFYRFSFFGIIIVSLIFTILFLVFRSRNIKNANKLLAEKNMIITEQSEKLLELNKTKDKLFAIISHDLKNPIGAFKNSLSLADSIFDDFTKEELHDLISELSKSALSVYDMLEDLLSWARIQQGKITFNPSENDIYYLIDKIIYFLNESAKQKNISLETTIKPNTIIETDIFLIHTILRNLISNAIKFTNQGGYVRIGFESTNDTNILIIEDNGIGIEPEKIEKLFKIDDNISTVGTAGEKGTGMGLVLCNEFVEMHKGKLTVESELNKGTKMKIILKKKY